VEVTTPAAFPRKVWLFGSIRVETTQRAIHIPGGSARTLMAYLVLHPDIAHTRERLADLLWPESPPDRVRRQFSDTLYRLRQALGGGWLISEGETVRLDRATGLWVDVWSFETLQAAGDTQSIEQAVALYKGDLVPEITHEWILPKRVLLRESYFSALLLAGREAEENKQYERALRYYRRLSFEDPLREAAQRGLMGALAALGRLGEALESYSQFNQHLRSELDASPSNKTVKLANQLRQEWEVRQSIAASAKIPPFVGRAAERAQLLARLDQAYAGHGGIVVLLGEAGIGKTRLLQVLQESAVWRGWQVIYDRGEEFGLRPPFAPLPAVLAGALPPPRAQQMAQLIAPHWLALIARIVPDLNFDQQLAEDIEPQQAIRQMSKATGKLLAGLTEIAPHLLILDDVQWADETFWELLTALHPDIAHLPLLLMISGRNDELQSQDRALDAIQTLERAGAPVLSMSPLAAEALSDLAAAMGHGQLTSVDIEALRTRSGGNPLLALALLEASGRGETKDNDMLADLMQRRLERVAIPAQLALQAAAVLGYQFDYELWTHLTPGLPSAEMPAVAGELERNRLIELAGDGYQFAHDTLRAHVYTGTPSERRVHLHQNALSAIKARNPEDNLTLLRHAQGGQDQPAVAQYAMLAGDESFHAFAYKAASDYYALALDALPKKDRPARYQVLLGLVKAYDNQGLRDKQGEVATDLVKIADHLTDLNLKAEASYHQADLHWKVGDQDQALSFAKLGLKRAQNAGETTLAADLMVMLGRIARNQGDFAQSENWLVQARNLYQQEGNSFGEANTLDKLANLRHERGDYEQAAAQHTQAAQRFRDLGRLRHEARALSGLALSVRAMGDFDRARGLHKQIIAISEELGDLESQWVEQVNLGNIAYVLGDFQTAITWYEASLPLIHKLDDPYALSLVLFNTGEAHRELEDLIQARLKYNEALEICRERDFQRGKANVLHGLGLISMAEGRYGEAVDILKSVQQIWGDLNQPVKEMDTNAALALTWFRAGNLEKARHEIEAALADLGEGYRATDRWRWIHYIAYLIRQAEGRADSASKHLRQAGQALQELVDRMPKEAHHHFLNQVPVNRLIGEALQEHSHRIQVRLVRMDAPLGRELTNEDYIVVTWTLSTPVDDIFTNNAERRRNILKRLLAEAEAQGAAPTDSDLAQALDVSSRTVERDIKSLHTQDYRVQTRRRRT
jgi:DNA-binding SARP family transcriptional activator